MNTRPEANTHKALRISAKVSVADVVLSRYASTTRASSAVSQRDARPSSWDERVEGVDVIRAVGGETIRLRSSAMQSTPKPGWVIVLTGGSEQDGYSWTLYGITPTH